METSKRPSRASVLAALVGLGLVVAFFLSVSIVLALAGSAIGEVALAVMVLFGLAVAGALLR